MTGSNAGFDPEAFREAIHFAMSMGSPTQTAEKATFRWTRQQSFTPQDPAHRPYNWTQTPATDTTPDDVVLDNVAVEFATNRAGGGTSVGDFVPLRATVTLLDDEYAQVQGADIIVLGGHTYAVSMTTVAALFSVDVYQMFCERV